MSKRNRRKSNTSIKQRVECFKAALFAKEIQRPTNCYKKGK